MTKSPVLLLGARSDIAKALAHRFGSDGRALQLAARNAASLESDRADLELRYGVSVTLHEFDALATDTHADFVRQLPELPEIAVCAVGLLGAQVDSERDTETAVRIMRSNYEGPASILAVLANSFERRQSGTLVGISSVAGQRGRASNYIYGSAKAGFTAFLSGLRNRLAKKGVHVVTVLPGFVATQMTDGMRLPPALTAQPAEVAAAIAQAVARKRNVIFVRPVWRLVMAVVCSIPESLFKNMKV